MGGLINSVNAAVKTSRVGRYESVPLFSAEERSRYYEKETCRQVLMMKMNSMTMVFAVCLSGTLFMVPSCDAVKHENYRYEDPMQVLFRGYHRWYQTKESVSRVEMLSNSEEETVTRGFEVEGPSQSEQTIESASPATTASSDTIRSTTPPKPLIVHRFCRTRDIVRAYVRVCSRLRRSPPQETVAHGSDDDEPSMSKRLRQLNTNAEKQGNPASLVSIPELLISVDSRNDGVQSAVEKLTDHQSIASAGEGWSDRGMVGERRPSSIRIYGPVFNLLRMCCKSGCTDKDIDDRLCGLELLTP